MLSTHIKGERMARQHRCSTRICLYLHSSIFAPGNPPASCPWPGVLIYNDFTGGDYWCGLNRKHLRREKLYISSNQESSNDDANQQNEDNTTSCPYSPVAAFQIAHTFASLKATSQVSCSS